MRSTPRAPGTEVTGILGAIVQRHSRRTLGQVPEPLGVMWHDRPVLEAFLGLLGRAEGWDARDRRLEAFAHMAAVSPVGWGVCLADAPARGRPDVGPAPAPRQLESGSASRTRPSTSPS